MKSRIKTEEKRGSSPLRIILITVVITAIVFSMAYVAVRQSREIEDTLNESAYTSVKNTLKSLAEMISNAFAMDEQHIRLLASSLSNEEDIAGRIQDIELNSNVHGIYYGEAGAELAAGTGGKTIRPADYTFVTHANGQERSKVYMNAIGAYAYLSRVPVQRDGVIRGYLYAEYLMTRFGHLLPSNVEQDNDVSIMDAQTHAYVYTPSNSNVGVHVKYQALKYYLEDPSLADAYIAEIESAVENHQYYMNIMTFSHVQNNQAHTSDYIAFLWPVDDGEYYITGFSHVEYVQSERISVQKTISTLIAMLIAICIVVIILIASFFGSSVLAARRNTELQRQHNRELSEALHIARAANESKSNFLSNMSHDIRTPMNAIVGFTTLLLREADSPDKVREYAKKISGSSDYLLDLINDVLDMSKIESGKTTLSVAEFSIGEMVHDVESIVRMQAENNHQSFKVTLADVESDCVMGDELRVRQIIMNLLSNALKYTPGGGSIAFSVTGVPQEKKNIQRLRIVVADTGYGIAKDHLDSIFEPFTRVDNSMTGKIQGTGLGLAITKNIVDLMGGTISVESELKKGSRFTVELGLAACAKTQEQHTTDQQENEMQNCLDGLHILAAEDNELNAEILAELLSMENATCKVCEDGEKVVSEFNNAEPGTYDLF